MSLEDELASELNYLETRARLRVTQSYGGADRIHPISSGSKPLVSFCSNDYLGLATHSAVRNAAADSALADGVGAGASRLVCGETPAHRALERNLAAFMNVEQALLFPSGYQANIGTLTALAGPEDFIASDAANHASLIDGCRLSRARVAIYEHANAASAAAALEKGKTARRRFLLTESLFSMDGDRAPLPHLAAICQTLDAYLVVDEAHALGCLGPSGRGICASLDIRPTAIIGTLGKAFGTSGGFVATSTVIRDTLVNRARTYIFTTAAPGPIVAATLAALEIIRSAEGDDLRLALKNNVARIATAIPARPHPGLLVPDHIMPVLVGSDAGALRLAAHLREQGLLVPAIRPPTVPEGTARLRLTVSATHSQSDVDTLIGALANIPQLASLDASGPGMPPAIPNFSPS
jgi:8-amino-7-oxononanoate synthase